MISLIVYPNGLRFINVYIYCKPPYQPKYQYLRKVLEPLKEIGYFEYTDDKNIVAMDHQLFLTAVIEPPTAEEPPGSSAVMEPLTTAEEPLGSSDENNSGEPPRKRPKLQDLDASGRKGFVQFPARAVQPWEWENVIFLALHYLLRNMNVTRFGGSFLHQTLLI
nr:unnamed protein product [Callosobruchus analis]